MKLWLGKYRATVRAPGTPKDPLGALWVNVPEVMGAVGVQRALPCFPSTGIASGTAFIPLVGSPVWVEFEGGNKDKPIWIGGFYPAAPMGPPAARLAPAGTESVVVQTTLQNTLSIIDVPGPTGGILLRAATGASIMINDLGIILQDGKGGMISMTNGTVSINRTNLVVLP